MLASLRTQWLLTGLFLCVIACESLIQGAIDLRQGEPVQFLDLVRQAPSERHLRVFEAELEDRAWPAVMTRSAMQSVQYSLYSDLGEKALAGRDGWLFYRPDVDFLIEPWPPKHDAAPIAEDPLPAILAFRDELAERDIALLVMPAPGKPSVYPDKLSRRSVDFSARPDSHVQHLFTRLDDAGVLYVDLFSIYREARARGDEVSYYLAQDTHWSPAGLRAAATAVAERLIAEGWVTPGEAAYTVRPAPLSRIGDVLRMVDAEAVTAKFQPEQVACEQVVDVAGEPYADDPESPVLVLGDSFLRIFERDEPKAAGFIAHLAAELDQPVASIVSDGGASTLVRQELQRNPDLLRYKKVVIWEFVERDLRFGTDSWQVVKLPTPDA